jgi:hypothetical protein
MTATYGIAESAADLIKAMYGAPFSGSSTTDSGTPSGSSSGGNNLGAAKSTLSTGAKAAIAGQRWLLRLHLWQYAFSPSSFFPADFALFLSGPDSHVLPQHPRQAHPTAAPTHDREEGPMVPVSLCPKATPTAVASFMPMGTRAPPPSEGGYGYEPDAPVHLDARTAVADTVTGRTRPNSPGQHRGRCHQAHTLHNLQSFQFALYVLPKYN